MTTTATPTKCTECHRTLTAPASIARRMGDTCARNARRRLAAAVLTRTFKNAEAAKAKALQLLTDKALVPTRHAGQYLATSTDGATAYLVDTVERSCTCKGHTRIGRCYHLVAADLVEIVTARRTAYALAA